MPVTWGHIRVVRRMWQDLPSKLDDLVGNMWPSVVLQKHYPFRELVSTLVLDGLFNGFFLMALRTPLSSYDKFGKHAPLLREETK